MSNFNFVPPNQHAISQPARVRLSKISDLIKAPASPLNLPGQAKPPSLKNTALTALNLASTTPMGSSRPTLANPSLLFDSAPKIAPAQTKRTQTPDFLTAGKQISAIAENYGYRRGQVISDRSVIQAMMNQAGTLYQIPGDFLFRTAMRESGAKHWDKQGQVKSAAAVGIMQIEKSAYPKATKTGPADALNNAYDLGNNIALGAANLSQSIKRLAKQTGYTGKASFQDLAPLLNISYNAGSGALNKAMNKARSMGLDPFNWQHLAFGRNVQIPAGGKFNLPTDWIETAPLHLALKEIHDGRAAKGIHNYPIYWTDANNLKLHDFDQNGTTTRAEHLISRIVYTMTGKTLKAQ